MWWEGDNGSEQKKEDNCARMTTKRIEQEYRVIW
jgi:hypothetical protein